MMPFAVSALLVIVAVIHLLPLAGLAGPRVLASLYGINIVSPEIDLLMRHRTVLFGILGAFLLCAAFRPAWQPAAIAAGAISVLSFLGLAWHVDGADGALRSVVIADWIAAGCLLAATIIRQFGANAV